VAVEAAGPVVSVCIVTGRRLRLLDAALACLADQRGAPPFEVLVCSDGDPEVAAVVLARFPSARICQVAGALPGAARNLLVAEATGSLLLFLDDDITFGPDLVADYAALAAAHPEMAVFGGPNDTPPGSSRFQLVQGAVLASIIGSGPVRRRYGAHPAGAATDQALILCNLAVRREAMVPFPRDLVCAEENAVLSELRRRGVGMYYAPDLVVYHERRATLGGFARQMLKYGRGRGQLVRREPRAMRLSYAVPSALLAYLVALPVLVVALGAWTGAPLLAYALAVLASAGWVARTLRRPVEAPRAAGLLLVLHLCYGLGVLRGVAERPRAVAAPEPLWWSGPPGTVPAGDAA
jgi:GT2 family glycosyltransferase